MDRVSVDRRLVASSGGGRVGSIHPASFGRSAARRRRIVISCAAPFGTGWDDCVRVGRSANNRAKYYSLTLLGRKQLAKESDNWSRLSEAIARVIETT